MSIEQCPLDNGITAYVLRSSWPAVVRIFGFETLTWAEVLHRIRAQRLLAFDIFKQKVALLLLHTPCAPFYCVTRVVWYGIRD